MIKVHKKLQNWRNKKRIKNFLQEKEKLRRPHIQRDGRYYFECNCYVEIIDSPTNEEPMDLLGKLHNDEFKHKLNLIQDLLMIIQQIRRMILQM